MPQSDSAPQYLARLNADSAEFEIALDQLQRKLSVDGDIVSETGKKKTIETFGEPLSPTQVVDRICEAVKSTGQKAVLDFTFKFDEVQLDSNMLRVAKSDIAHAHQNIEPDFLLAIRSIRQNIEQFQQALLQQDVKVKREPGVNLTQRYHALKRIGICVPGGAAAYPSTVLMTAVPAIVAGVEQIAVVAPPTDYGANNPYVLATCHELGISEVYRIGGAQAVAAMAYGIDGLPRVDKIVGPGNLFVALAKRRVYGDVDIDSIAGPSEVVVVADDSANPHWVALDLLAQAEHSPGSSVLVTWNAELMDKVEQAIEEIADTLDRADLALASLKEYGCMIQVADRKQAIEVTNRLAPEHLQLSIDDAKELAKSMTNAGAVFVGHLTTVALGDYVAGPSHVLPTGATARWASGLNANDFLRSSSMIEYDAASLDQDANALEMLANIEGLTAHRESVIRRMRP